MDTSKMGEIKDPRGRKPKELDPQLFENLCSIFCTQAEICEIMDVDHKTLVAWVERHYEDNFSQVYKKNMGKGKMSLRRAQLKMAQTNPTMAIWLGKQFLNQLDKVEEQITGNVVIKNEVPAGDNDASLPPRPAETPEPEPETITAVEPETE
jgi:hypothetical protein